MGSTLAAQIISDWILQFVVFVAIAVISSSFFLIGDIVNTDCKVYTASAIDIRLGKAAIDFVPKMNAYNWQTRRFFSNKADLY